MDFFLYLPSWVQMLIGLLLITNLVLLSAERQRTCINILVLQGIVLGFMPLAMKKEIGLDILAITSIFLLIKALFLPGMLFRAHKILPPSQPLRPYMGYGLCVVAGLAGLGFALWLETILPEPANPYFLTFFTPAFTTILAGLLMIITRRKALTQVMGYLVMENGIYLLSVPLAQDDYMWLELSILLDIFAAIVIMVLTIHQLNKVFDTTDVEQIASLRD